MKKTILFILILFLVFLNAFSQDSKFLKLSKPVKKPFGIKSKDLSTPVFVDIDNDGDLDLFGLKGNIGGGNVYFMENTGTKSKPKFANPVKKPFGIKSKDLTGPVFVDIDNDGDLDLFGLKSSIGGGNVYFMENTGTKSKPEFAKPVKKPFGIKSKDLFTPVFVDIDNDGDLDLFGLQSSIGGGTVYFMENTGTKSKPEFAKPVKKPFGIKSKDLSTPQFVDIDNDGDLDLFGLKGSIGGGYVYFMENTGTKSKPEFAKPVKKPFGIKSKDLSTPVFVDIDNDGDLDLFGLKAGIGGGTVYFMENKVK